MPNLVDTIRDALAAVADDVVNLDVVTLTGDIAIGSAVENQKISLKKLLEEIQNQASIEAKLDVIGYTHIDLDADSVNYVGKTAPDALLKAHNDAVMAAQETRRGIVEMAVSIFKK